MSSAKIAELMFGVPRRFGQIKNLRHVARLGLPFASSTVRKESDAVMKATAGLPGLAPYLTSPAILADLSAKAAQTQLSDFQMSIDSASLIFAHSIADAAVFDLCEVSAAFRPMDWEQALKDRKISLAELKGKEYDQVLSSVIDGYLLQLERASLPDKVKQLLGLCKPEPGIMAYEGYTFSAERLRAIDQLRHDVTHGGGPRNLTDVDDDISFLERTVLALVSATMKTYNIRPSLNEVLEAIRIVGA